MTAEKVGMPTGATMPPIFDDAGLSSDGAYRYWLTRRTMPRHHGFNGYVNFIGLNPSTATASEDDATVRRLKGFARSWGYDGFWLTNLFAFRATDPADLCFAQRDVVGPDNDEWLIQVASRAGLIVAAWGAVDGLIRNNVRFAQRRASVVANVLLGRHSLHCVRVTKAGFPGHPLYVRSDASPQLWRTA